MTYDARETSADLGAPTEIYEFTRGVYRVRLASGDRDIVYLGQTFARTAISRTSVESSVEASRAGITITMPRIVEVADWHRVAAPADVITVSVLQRHIGDPDAEFAVVWQGRIVSVDFAGAIASVTCESVYTSIRRPGLRRAYQRTCPHVLYKGECKVVDASFQTIATVASVSGLVVSATIFGTLPAGYLSGGYLQMAKPDGQVERRSITNHAGEAITLSQIASGLSMGSTVIVFPGCDHTLATCASKFANALNFGGMPYIPSKNPFDGSPVY